uniref:Sigma-54, DNA binding domain n=1 Tax=Candidatus Kentrum eta TaxID=2126337 RepID=A0A450V7D8_9GAMM|nr:MAG: Sigma-54, DNA binding domain [Candidatus Kentron sp. H]VFJ94032.1 MAG: Sigma-54, DNA binding domain [Candidatus Kentron sp. H]VFK00698.1 MAG: Sigma-54, DNA binding domain [Candidatus Kentron sp. H]
MPVDKTSSTAVCALIKRLVAAENARKPENDAKLAEFLSEQGINVARRMLPSTWKRLEFHLRIEGGSCRNEPCYTSHG